MVWRGPFCGPDLDDLRLIGRSYWLPRLVNELPFAQACTMGLSPCEGISPV